MKDDWEPRPAIYPAEWLEEDKTEMSVMHDGTNWVEFPGFGPDNKPLPKFEIDFLQAFHGLDAPYTVEEVKKLFPGLYFPIEH